MPTYAARIAHAEARLRPVTDTPRLDAEILLAASLGLTRAQLLARLREEGDAPEFEALLARRLRYEPIAYILGEWEFFGINFHTRAPVLVPRPETEHLVEVVLQHISGIADPIVMDVCTGSGCVALALAQHSPRAQVFALDQARPAIALAQENIALHKMGERVRLLSSDMLTAVAEVPRFHAICANPPYVEAGDWEGLPEVIRRHEDPAALLAGADGLDCIRQLIEQAAARLLPGGVLAFELGEGQAQAAIGLLTESGNYEAMDSMDDLAGIARIVSARRRG